MPHRWWRRAFIALLGCAAGALLIDPRVGGAQPTLPVIGFLNPSSASSNPGSVEAFRRGLAEVGYVEGRNVTIEYLWADGRYDRLPELAADLVRRGVTVIAAGGSSAPGLAAKAATTTIPI